MSNLEAVEVLKNTGQMVTLMIARVKDSEITVSEEEGTEKLQEQRLGSAIVASSSDDPYSMIAIFVLFEEACSFTGRLLEN